MPLEYWRQGPRRLILFFFAQNLDGFFLGHVIQVVDHAGHHAAIGSIGAGVLTLAASLASANPLLVAFHIAGVYSGAAWSLGLTTGSAHWLLRHIHRAGDQQLFPEQKTK